MFNLIFTAVRVVAINKSADDLLIKLYLWYDQKGVIHNSERCLIQMITEKGKGKVTRFYAQKVCIMLQVWSLSLKYCVENKIQLIPRSRLLKYVLINKNFCIDLNTSRNRFRMYLIHPNCIHLTGYVRYKITEYATES